MVHAAGENAGGFYRDCFELVTPDSGGRVLLNVHAPAGKGLREERIFD
jgi:hypothetical protein